LLKKLNFSNSFKWNFHGSMNLLVVFGNRLDIGVPSVFSLNLFNSLFLILVIQTLKSSCKGIIGSVWKTSLTLLLILPWRFCELIPFKMRSSQKWNTVSKLLSFVHFFVIFPFVWNIAVQNKRSSINWSLKSTKCWSHTGSIFRFILNTHSLNSLSGDWFTRSVLSKEFWVCHCWVVECYMIVHGSIKVFTISYMSSIIVFSTLNIKIWNPSKLSINIPIFTNSRIIWHSSSFDFIHFIRIVFSSGFY